MVGEASMVNYLSIHIVMYFFKGVSIFCLLWIKDVMHIRVQVCGNIKFLADKCPQE